MSHWLSNCIFDFKILKLCNFEYVCLNGCCIATASKFFNLQQGHARSVLCRKSPQINNNPKQEYPKITFRVTNAKKSQANLRRIDFSNFLWSQCWCGHLQWLNTTDLDQPTNEVLGLMTCDANQPITILVCQWSVKLWISHHIRKQEIRTV